MTLAERIITAREKCGITQVELAEKLNTTRQNIWKYEHGVITNLPLSRISELAQALNVSESYLMGWEEEKENAPTQRDKSIETIMALFRKLDNDQKMEVIMFAANLIGNNEPKSTDFPSSTGQSE